MAASRRFAAISSAHRLANFAQTSSETELLRSTEHLWKLLWIILWNLACVEDLMEPSFLWMCFFS